MNDTRSSISPPPHRTRKILRIFRDSDTIYCSRECANFAKQIGFGGDDLWEISIAVSELVANVIKFATEGMMIMRPLSDPKMGIEIIIEDDGPGFTNIEDAMKDGFSEGRMRSDESSDGFKLKQGLGAGLGAVNRLMDELVIENRKTRGARITTRKFLSNQ